MDVKRSNPKAFETLNYHLSELAKVEGRVGWSPSAKYDDPNETPVAYVASIQELGYAGGNIPPRPFIRPTVAEKKQAWGQTAAEASKMVIQGKISAAQAMRLITTQAQGDIIKKIESITSPPLSAVTIELRAMKKRNPDLRVTRSTVWEAIRKVNSPGYQTPNVSVKPLNDSGHMIATLDQSVVSV